MSQFAEKSILAKLLATENIHVEHQKTSTAYFNLETRTVVLPIFKETSADLYDLLIGHEVGHALETPADGWHSSISEKGVGFKSFLNIIEDARIERKMKNRYPGLRRSFYNGYKELFEQNFFGVEGMDVNKLKFIDRINLNAKVGSFLNVKFSEEEQAIVNRLDDLNTWEDVVALATELYERAENSTEELDFEQFLNQFQMDGDGDGEFDPTAEYVEVPSDGQANEGKPEPQAPPSKGQKSEDTSEESQSSSSDSTDEKSEEKEDGSSGDSESDDTEESPQPTSFTDENFRRNEDSLLDANARETFYAKLPILNPADFIVGINTVETMLKFSVGGAAHRAGKTAEQVKMELYKEFLTKNGKYLSAMAQDFERKKKAKSLMRAQTSKTGRINMDKVWAYKITEDLFLQNTVVPNGQNHGMLLYLDMSGSMSPNMSGTMEQLVLLASFCQKVRIPFEVYGFITNSSAPQTYFDTVRSRNNLSDPANLMISDPSFRMLQLVATGVSGGKFKTQMANLLALGQSYNRSYHDLYLDGTAANSFGLGSTPLEEAILLGRYIAEDFKNRNRVEVLSSVFLTDGEGDCNFETVGHNHNDYHRKNLAIVDSKTRRTFLQQYDGNSYRSRSYCKALLDLYRETTGSRMINFYLMGSYDLKYFLARSLLSGVASDAARKAFKKESAALLKNINGFDDQFLIKAGSSLQIKEDTLTVDSNDKKELTKAFKAFQDKKSIGRVILTKMVEAVA
jgi:hypothetical protein